LKLLLDTHVLLWWLDDDPRLSSRCRDAIADPQSAILVSVATVWEIAIKAGLGQLDMPPDLGRYLHSQIHRNSFDVLPVGFAHAVAVRDLPWHHKDPFDRLLIAQSRTEQIPIASADAVLASYEVELVW
jgi:PIN domain nuclease of toxin-antitoxin system